LIKTPPSGVFFTFMTVSSLTHAFIYSEIGLLGSSDPRGLP